MSDWVKEQEKEGYTCIPNPFGSGFFCYKDKAEFERTCLRLKYCPKCLKKISKKHFWADKYKCKICGYVLME